MTRPWFVLLVAALLCARCVPPVTHTAPLAPTDTVEILEPLEGAIYPRDMAPPLFEWRGPDQNETPWLLEIRLPKGPPLRREVPASTWQPDPGLWEHIKQKATGAPVTLCISRTGGPSHPGIAPSTRRFFISDHAVEASILYRQLPLPYQISQNYLRRITWKLGAVADGSPPKTVMTNQPVCSGCHQTSADGRLLAMEMNIKGDGGAHWVKPVASTMEVTETDTMSWSDYPTPPFLPDTRGSFAKLSPTGRFMVSPVNEISFMVLTGDAAYSQLFFPTFGFLGIYHRQTKTFAPLKGAQDWDYAHTDPSWYPDESALLFARAETKNAYHPDLGNIRTLTSAQGIQALNQTFPVRFDICRLPFEGGKGGTATPLPGASHNGMSNYFARVSPDGNWVVFTQSRSGLMLQPDSTLYIVPAAGGTARKLTCNRPGMNSWHAWSPNGRWLVFASKSRTMTTELFLTHIDENGTDSPAIRLHRFSHPTMAANIPEFVPFKPEAIDTIRLK
ncbi:TolB family protein [Desulfoluna spongiiphila]|uniref:WD40-like Beta Propeller Repeat n=1 Tax=Desulfoluna spongiiphila TaxID=419481 RepID=A0A1G5GHQ1_9BACT|nr:PD40 domain-containing protein [Desulfoluna spongiiphila]SCY50877.1 WD40-like Beta Propeller Repeat [Desulfoluna spongiiphila]